MTVMTQPNTESLARAEEKAASTVDMGVKRWVLAAAVAIYVVALFLPFVGGASLWQALAVTDAAKDAQTALTEYVFAWISLIGVGVLTTLAVVTQRFALAVPAWMVTTVSLVYSVLGIWLRNSNASGISRGPARGSDRGVYGVPADSVAQRGAGGRREAARRSARQG